MNKYFITLLKFLNNQIPNYNLQSKPNSLIMKFKRKDNT